MKIDIYWVITEGNGALGIMPRPHGGEELPDEMYALRETGVDTVVSLLTAGEQWELDLLEERELCNKSGMQFISFPIEDRRLPHDSEDFLQVARALRDRIQAEKKVVVHCRIGIGRAALVAAGVLVLLGETAENAFQRISAVRGCQVPDTEEQCQWLCNWCHIVQEKI